MEKRIETLLTPQIISDGVTYDKTTRLDGAVGTRAGGERNCVRIMDGSAEVCGKTVAEVNQGLGYIRQLEVLFDGDVPVCEFEFASPSFEYRGFHIDVCRHFMSVDELKRIINVMSMVGYNVFHWHLTDDQGWRFGVEGYPLLESIASVRANTEYIKHEMTDGGFYSDDDLRDIVGFCSERGMTVVPEIEVPGHTKALLAAYPQFGCTGNKVLVEQRWGIFDDVINPASPDLWTFLDAAFGKLCSIFPGPYIHMGGDECPHGQWETNPECIALMKENSLKDGTELQGWFTSRLSRLISSYGKRAMGWDEVVDAPSIDKDVVVMSWRGLDGARTASSRGHNVVLCPQQGMYLDKGYTSDSFEPSQWGVFTVKDSFDIDLGMQELPEDQRKLILGAQCNVWTERMASGRAVEYMMFPRVFAIADNMWNGQSKSWERLCRRREAMKDLCWKLNLVCSPAAWEERP
ncbi:MAG: family 20 glycosylhydrolase [Spirochaetales bacterium]|nr:family 20 glycosylhydrolase [Spirochaetales bacterium]